MEFLIIRPADAHPQPRQFDGPVSLALALALMIEGPAEEVPGFTSISQQGVIRRCAAYSAENAKEERAARQFDSDSTLARSPEAPGP